MRRFRFRSLGRRATVVAAGAFAVGMAGTPTRAGAQAKARPGGMLSVPGALAENLQTSSGECCKMLLFPIGARRTAMSEAVTALPSPDAVFYNPSGLAEVDDSHFVLHHAADSRQQVDAFTLLFSPGNLATFGVTYELIDFGDTESTDDVGTVIGTSTTRQHVVIASFATTLVAGLSAGLSYKYFAFRIDCSGQCGRDSDLSAATHGVDLGVQYRPLWLSAARFGAAVTNLGFPLQVINSQQADPMPTRLRVGMSYDVMEHFDSAGPYRLILLVDAQDENWRNPGSPIPSVGMELSAGDVVFLRAGYGGGEGIGSGPAVGVGIVYASFNLGVAKRVSSSGLGDDPFQLSLDVAF